MKAYHFTNGKLRNGDPLPKVGEKLTYDGKLELCKSGLHASKKILDAVKYAPGSMLCRVECGGKIIQDKDKLVCSERTILWKIDATEVLKKFARLCALDVIHMWDAPKVVIEYLKTGDEGIRAAAYYAAYYAANSAAYSAAYSDAYYAADSAANSAIYSVAAVADSAAYSVAYSAAYSVAKDTAWAAANSAAAAYAARTKQNKRLVDMIREERKII